MAQRSTVHTPSKPSGNLLSDHHSLPLGRCCIALVLPGKPDSSNGRAERNGEHGRTPLWHVSRSKTSMASVKISPDFRLARQRNVARSGPVDSYSDANPMPCCSGSSPAPTTLDALRTLDVLVWLNTPTWITVFEIAGKLGLQMQVSNKRKTMRGCCQQEPWSMLAMDNHLDQRSARSSRKPQETQPANS